jgi:hypothetical protein
MSPRVQAISYLVVGVLAVVSGIYFVTRGAQLLDYLILGGGVIAVYLGVRDLLRLRQDS